MNIACLNSRPSARRRTCLKDLVCSTRIFLAKAAFCIAATVFAACYQPSNGVGATFTNTGSLNTARRFHTATLLNSGKVLVAAGSTTGSYQFLDTTEIYDPITGAWNLTGQLNTPRDSHSAALLPSGKVIVAAGRNLGGATSSVELYDPDTGTWTNAGPLNTARLDATATVLDNGKVLVAGGYDYSGHTFHTAELYDPVAETWMSLSNTMSTSRTGHTATLLTNGQVLVTGGFGSYPDSSTILSSAELFDPASGSWTIANSMSTPRQSHTATLLQNGNVLVIGGANSTGAISDAELYDPSSGTWITISNKMSTPRVGHTATLLNDGMVLVAGGSAESSASTALASAELYNPAGRTWQITAPLNVPREGHTATLLSNGTVLMAGGLNELTNILSSCEIYVPGALLTVTITEPPRYAPFCLGSDISIAASVSNNLPISKVEFFAGNALLDAVTSAPFQITWPSPAVGNYDLTARVTDSAGNSVTSPVVPVVVSAGCTKPVAIVRPQPDPEIDALQSYLLQMGLGSRVFDQAGLTNGMLNGFVLVVWDDLGLTNSLQSNTVDVLSQVYSSTTPLYLIGEHLASSTELLQQQVQQTEWTNLTQLSFPAGVGGDGSVEVNDPEGPSNPILTGQFGQVTNFPYPARLELTTNLQSDAEVLGTTAGYSVLSIYPGLEAADQTPTRLVRQDFRVVPPDDLDATNTLRVLFQNSVCWLTRCQGCQDTSLGLSGLQSNDVVQIGQTNNYILSASCSGECQPTGVVVTNQIPLGFDFVSASTQQGSWAYDATNREVVFYLGLMPQDGTVSLGISAVAAQAGTFTNTAGVRYNSTNAPVLLDPVLVTTVLPNTNAMPPVLSLQMTPPSTLQLSLSGQTGVTYEIQFSSDLTNWTSLTNVPGPSWTQTIAPWPITTPSPLFYRAKVD